jgi:hypothetical protein
MTDTTSRPWDSVLEHYYGLLEYHWPVGPMIDLVESIIESPYRYCLHALTSHETLMIGLYERPAREYWMTGALVIEPGNGEDSRPTFRYQDWTERSSDPVATLESFLSRAGWAQRTTEIANPS